ncbi:repeat and SOCS box 3 isoform X2 [Octopus vulgaris]|uniref:Repeat and SOCS box 3 isoform X2 n=1 Tax=Octopus vulgaris TaxID=6645 RepID=A0AA36FFH9_OCTVU|nr:repeat and SOCS box 3 isoform X2 [Octopus vulgaris]
MVSVVSCVKQNNQRILSLLLDVPGSVPKNELKEALLLSSEKGYIECTNSLIKAGADIDCQNSSGETPLILATKENKPDIIKALIEAKCDCYMTAKSGNAAIHIAAQKDLLQCFQILLDNGVDINTRDPGQNTPLIISSHSECIEDMLEAGLDLNILDNEYRTPLWYALYSGRFEAVESLLKYTSHVASFNCPAHAPETSCPVKLAFLKGAKKVIKQFILIGFDKDHIRYYIQNSDDVTADWTTVDQNDWFSFIQQPLTLLQISRIWIRHYLGRLFYLNVSKLPLPKSFQDFLLFSDFKNI